MKGMLLPLPRSAYKRPTVNDILKARHRPPADNSSAFVPAYACRCCVSSQQQPSLWGACKLHSNSCRGLLLLLLPNADHYSTPWPLLLLLLLLSAGVRGGCGQAGASGGGAGPAGTSCPACRLACLRQRAGAARKRGCAVLESS